MAHQLDTKPHEPAMHKGTPGQVLHVVGKEMLWPLFGSVMTERNTNIVDLKVAFNNRANTLIGEPSNLICRIIQPLNQCASTLYSFRNVAAWLLPRLICEMPVKRRSMYREDITTTGNIEFRRRSTDQVVIDNHQFWCYLANVFDFACISHADRLRDISIGRDDCGHIDQPATALPGDILSHIHSLSAPDSHHGITWRRGFFRRYGSLQVHILYINYLERRRANTCTDQCPWDGHGSHYVAPALGTQIIDYAASKIQVLDVGMR